jgi:hypothetical protein
VASSENIAEVVANEEVADALIPAAVAVPPRSQQSRRRGSVASQLSFHQPSLQQHIQEMTAEKHIQGMTAEKQHYHAFAALLQLSTTLVLQWEQIINQDVNKPRPQG